ncbi:MAG: hypothetical protein ABIO51_03910 [Solirubrobacteraceae bacterium]
MKRLISAAVISVGLLMPSGAAAGVPVTLGNANHSGPTVTAGGGGIFHVLWDDPEAFVYHYCQVQLPSLGCAKSTVIAFNVNDPAFATAPNGAPERAWIVLDPDGGPLRLVIPKYLDGGSTHEAISFDEGTTFSAVRRVHKEGNGVIDGRPILEDDGLTVLVPRANIDGPMVHDDSNGDSAEMAYLDTGGNAGLYPAYNPSLANVTGSTILTGDDLENLYVWKAPDGSPLTAASSWGTRALVGPGYDSTMAGGGGDAFVASTDTRAATPRFDIRKWGGLAFGPPALIAPTNGYVADLTVTAGGTPGVVYRDNDSGLRFATLQNGKYDPKTIVHNDEIFGDVNVAYDDTGVGLAVWPRDGAIAAADVTEVADPSVPRVSKTRTKNGITLGLTVSGSCVRPGKPTTVVTGGQGRGKVEKVVYTLGGQTKTDKSMPFRATFTVPKAAAAGARIAVTAKHFVERNTAPKKFSFKIGSFVDVCGG